MVQIILISPAHIKDRNSGDTSGLPDADHYSQHGAGLFRLLGGER